MTNSVNSKPVGSLDDLENAAKDAAKQLGKVSRGNAIWEKTSKSLKQGLADLTKIRDDAEKEVHEAGKLYRSLATKYDSDASGLIKTNRTTVVTEIGELAKKQDQAVDDLKLAKDNAARAKTLLDESNENCEEAQKKLLGLPKTIQDLQKQLAGLRADVTDANNKHLLVEAVVKLEDLSEKTDELSEAILDSKEAQLWTALSEAVSDLIQKTEALATDQAVIPIKEEKLSKAKAARDEAEKTRLDRIKKFVADKPNTKSAKPPVTPGTGSP